jgi:hypothetical protein
LRRSRHAHISLDARFLTAGNKKADVVDALQEGIDHVGILVNGLPANGPPLI